MRHPALEPITTGKRDPGLLGWLVFFLLLGYAIDAPLRYLLSFVRLESLVYLRDVLFVIGVGVASVKWMLGEKRHFALVAVLYLLGAHFFFGVLNLQSLIQPLMGLKVVLAFAFGMAVHGLLLADHKKLYLGAWTIFVVVVSGVLVNYFLVYPWAGAILDSGVGQAALTREWTAGGVRRLAGFSRASYDAASIILVTLPVVLFSIRTRPLLGTVIFGLACTATALTTSKGALMAQAVFVVWLAVRKLLSPRPVDRAFVWGAAAVTTLFPLISVLAGVRSWSMRNDLFSWWFSSFHERMYRMWPDALANVTEHGSVLLGRGLGGMGFPQYFGEVALYNSADNVSVYMYVVFGLLGLIYLGVLYWACLRTGSRDTNSLVPFVAAAWALFCAVYGLTTNMAEQPFYCIALGAAVGVGLATGLPVRTVRGSRSVNIPGLVQRSV